MAIAVMMASAHAPSSKPILGTHLQSQEYKPSSKRALKIDREAPIYISNQGQYQSKSIPIQIDLELNSSLRFGYSIAAVSIDMDCTQNLKIPTISANSVRAGSKPVPEITEIAARTVEIGDRICHNCSPKPTKTYKAVSRIEKLPCTSGSDPKFISRSVA